MDAPPIIIRIGAALESSVAKSFDTLDARAGRSAASMAKSAARGGADSSAALDREWRKQLASLNKIAAAQDKLYERNARNAALQAAKAGKATEQATDRAARAAERAAAREARAVERAAKARQKASDEAARAAMRGFEQIARAARAAETAELRASQRSSRRLGERFASSTANTATRFIAPYAPLASLARRTAGDLLRGAGVRLDPGEILGRAIDLNARATTLSANAFQEGAPGAAGVRQNPLDITREARGIGKKYGLDAGDVVGGLEKYTAVSGDLETGRKVLEDMAKLSLTTGANLDEVVDAAGQVGAVLKDTPDKAQRVADVMRVMAGQGRLGAVELKDLSVQMAKIAATAGRIEGDPGENIKRLGALVQLARQRGGATGGASAATAVARLADTVVTPARAAAFEKAGIKTTTKSGMIRDLPSIIFDTVEKFGRDPIRLKKLFASSIGAKPAEALANVFRQGGDMRGEFNRILHADTSSTQAEDLRRAMDTPQAKIKRFQASLDELGDKMMVSLLPAFDRLAPKLLELGEVVSKTMTWVAENPKSAIATAIGMSIARAGIESTLRAGIERILLGQGGGNAAALGAVAGGVGAAMTIASLAIATAVIGSAVINHLGTEDAKRQKEAVEAGAQAGTDVAKATRQFQFGDLAGAKTTANEGLGKANAGLEQVGNPSEHVWGDRLRSFADVILGSGEGVGGIRKATGTTDAEILEARRTQEKADSQTRERLLEEQRGAKNLLDAISRQLAAGIRITNLTTDNQPKGGRASQGG